MARIFRLPCQNMRARVTLYSAFDVPDGLGGKTRSWVSEGMRWAEILIPETGVGKAPKNPRLRAVLRRGAGTYQLPLRLYWRGQYYRVVQLLDVEALDVQQLICEAITV